MKKIYLFFISEKPSNNTTNPINITNPGIFPMIKYNIVMNCLPKNPLNQLDKYVYKPANIKSKPIITFIIPFIFYTSGP